MTKVYTFANQKGGVGKTTSAVSIGAFLSAHGRSVLVVDVDPQANATSSLGLEEKLVESLKNGERATVYHTLIEKTPVAEIIQTTRRPRLHLAPSSPILSGPSILSGSNRNASARPKRKPVSLRLSGARKKKQRRRPS